ncbi:acyl-CoA thioesterase II [Paraferrimonas sedimenticola]|uniref:Acyl-CoA thioesterase 2 n=1 Tax=Paraferrimonas sedimenticola TaxID=375674 RepID=A0AA37RNJ5_9GAMM|nr:acyl-CoA thioesterase II [Paraferrimonas sedimenticola]GLP94733.1 acyl-CoA thioesterase II [Paraferrimonas sedimenticola]
MSAVLEQLVELHNLETIEQGLYRGQSQDLGFGHVFGGQVIGQALAAAKRTVEASRGITSLHTYFLLPGDVSLPIVYDVEVIRDGGSFSTRRVKAIQKGRPIFYMTCSFQEPEEGFEHQTQMPEVNGPEGLLNSQQLAQAMVGKVPARSLAMWLAEGPIEMRPLNPVNPVKPEKLPAVNRVWFRANGTLPDDPRLHKYLLAYVSDFNFLTTTLLPHGVGFMTPGVRMATIDHSMWYHRDVNLNDWILFESESTSASGGRGLVHGKFYDPQGKLLVSASQEGLIRFNPPESQG